MNGARRWSGISRRIVTVFSEGCRLLTVAAREILIRLSCPYNRDDIPGLKLQLGVCKLALSLVGLDPTLRPQTTSEGVSL